MNNPSRANDHSVLLSIGSIDRTSPTSDRDEEMSGRRNQNENENENEDETTRMKSGGMIERGLFLNELGR